MVRAAEAFICAVPDTIEFYATYPLVGSNLREVRCVVIRSAVRLHVH
jgi:hypothetical protein